MKPVKLFEQFISEAMVLGKLEDEFNITLDLYDNGRWLDAIFKQTDSGTTVGETGQIND